MLGPGFEGGGSRPFGGMMSISAGVPSSTPARHGWPSQLGAQVFHLKGTVEQGPL